MQSFIQQMPALVGVLVGAIATYAITSATERARWYRTQSVRWDEKRVDAYGEYAHALKQVISVALRMAAFRESHPDGVDTPPEEDVATLAAAEEDRTIKWEAVLLLGSNEVVIAGRLWHQGAFCLQRLAYGKSIDMSLPEIIDAISKARRNFYEVTKRDIGMEVGASPEAYEWQIGKIAGTGIDDVGEVNWYKPIPER